MMAACQNQGHVGDRLVDRRDLFEERLEYRNVATQGRGPNRTQRRICRVCMDRKIAAIDGHVQTAELFS